MDLREWIEVMKKQGLVAEVEAEVDWNLEAAAIIASLRVGYKMI